MSFRGKSILLGVSGGIAAYKAVALCSRLVQAGADVKVIMTESAAKFVSPLTFQAISRNQVMTDTFEEKDPSVVSHIHLADHADLVVIAPATANMIAKLALGLGDDMLSTTLLAVTSPIVVAPAMNVHMYSHPAVVHNMELLRQRGITFIEPGEGQLACGYVGKGRLAEPEEIVTALAAILNRGKLLSGRKVMVTAGGTQERIDPVRYLTNDSSGKMGYAIARTARDMGAEVTLISGPSSLPVPAGVEHVPVLSALDMLEAVTSRFEQADIVIKSAAVADYRPAEASPLKIKKKDEELTIRLVKNPDILKTLGERKTGQFLVGFAAETNDVIEHAKDKLQRKNCDMIVANDVTEEGAGFGTDSNRVIFLEASGTVEPLPKMSKEAVAERLLSRIAERLAGRVGGGRS
ncbi:bifunctional phosphopantothenoylcysteine decarboxylase/phosphopantothenate--cysteine ligase CoaBC [Paenibacillus senegalensis]|uniref:bifunctional phosphopantothenoylcysteine decarboxylase/phosphopantothenate--cysteine ligase CoaBC n=1 Tax=Paenibacillus senegalensis TaxID=1465766 RepID=UPI000288F106|nr:bifunctional phosphopantothenoylcysteine decarboxylase/phosphopantothenate--cysteine ligase CoaBC [Paenibacillus senegalensis]